MKVFCKIEAGCEKGMVIIMDDKESLISVIVPVYNGESYLLDCIKSIAGQTYQNLEIIIINDGSTDGTGKVCTRIQELYNNVQIITMNDEGVSTARNAGIEAAHGEFITFVDADDRLRSDMIQVLYDCMMSTGSDVAGCRFFLWKSEDEWKKLSEEKNSHRNNREYITASKVYKPDTYVKEAVLQGNSRCWSKLYRRAAIGKQRFREGLSIGEDMLFLVDILPYVGKFVETEYPGYGYFQNPNGAINRMFTPRYMDQITCWELARKAILKMDKSLDAQVTALLIIGIMLTVGKLAILPPAERRRQTKYIRTCHEKLKDAMLVSGAYGKLSKGYQIKARMFQLLPNLYLTLYHLEKKLMPAKD